MPSGASSPETPTGLTEESIESLQSGLERARSESCSFESNITGQRLSSLVGAAEQILASARAVLNRRS